MSKSLLSTLYVGFGFGIVRSEQLDIIQLVPYQDHLQEVAEKNYQRQFPRYARKFAIVVHLRKTLNETQAAAAQHELAAFFPNIADQAGLFIYVAANRGMVGLFDLTTVAQTIKAAEEMHTQLYQPYGNPAAGSAHKKPTRAPWNRPKPFPQRPEKL